MASRLPGAIWWVGHAGAIMDQGWWTPIDAYCERTGPEFWSEPLNALSNFAFLVAAAAAWRLLQRAPRPDPAAAGLVGLVAVIGVGSFLFHTVATRWAAVADVAPIALFILLFLVAALRRVLGLGAATAALVAVAFQMGAMVLPALWRVVLAGAPDPLNGSAGYLPALLALAMVGALGARRRHPGGMALLAAAATFAVSLGLRSVDLAWCGMIPAGTHSVWHLLNAVVLYLCVRAAITWRAPMPSRPSGHGNAVIGSQ
ncbi:MAG: hypothetical protein ACOYOJ_08545 [Alsobacter sp.]